MFGRILWKEYREGRGVWVVMVALGVGILYVTPAITRLFDLSDERTIRETILLGLFVTSIAHGVVVGAMLLAGEKEGRTLALLDILCPERHRLWSAKLVAGLLLALTQAAVLALCLDTSGWLNEEGALRTGAQGSAPAWLLLICSTEAVLWGMVGSALHVTVLGAAGLGILFYVAGWLLSFLLGGLFSSGLSAQFQAPAAIVPRLLLDLVALTVSAGGFARDRSARMSEFGVGVGERKLEGVKDQAGLSPPRSLPRLDKLSPQTAQRSAPRLFWLCWRQQRGLLRTLAIVALCVGLGLAPSLSYIWPFFTLVVGVLCGVAVWGPDNAGGGSSFPAARYFGDRRLSPSLIWFGKTLFSLAAAAVVSLLAVAALVLHLLLFRLQGAGEAIPLNPGYLILMRTPWDLTVFAAVWLIHGFAVGQLLGLLCRKPIVAVVVSLLLAPGLVGLWLPSLIAGGLHLWQIGTVPLLLLLASRLVFWAWISDRLATPGTAVRLVLCGMLGLAVTVWGVCWRFVEVAGGEHPPFDVQSFRARLPDPEHNLTAQIIRQGVAELDEQLQGPGRFEKFLRGQKENGGAGPLDPPLPQFKTEPTDPFEEVRRRGWKEREPGMRELGEWLDRLFAGSPRDWVKKFESLREAPLGTLYDPRNWTFSTRITLTERCRELAPWLVARALQLQARGDEAGSLVLLDTALALSRHLRSAATGLNDLCGRSVENMTLQGWERWLDHRLAEGSQPGDRIPAGNSIENLKKAQAMLARHEGESPARGEIHMAEYVGLYHQLFEQVIDVTPILPSAERHDNGTDRHDNPPSRLCTLTLQIPWERARAERMLNLAFAETLKEEAGNVRQRRSVPSFWRRSWGWLIETGLGWRVRGNENLRLCRLRGMRLQLALACYQMRTGENAQRLEDLTPEECAELPLDPFTRRPFGYRVARAQEQLPIHHPRDEEPRFLAVAAGQGVVWSVGPDGRDDGGLAHVPATAEWASNELRAIGADVVFLGPLVRGP
jgi:hypothetical protein